MPSTNPKWLVATAAIQGINTAVRTNGATHRVKFEVSPAVTTAILQTAAAGCVLEWQPRDSEEWYRMSEGATVAQVSSTPDADGAFRGKVTFQIAQSEIAVSSVPILGSIQSGATEGRFRISPMQESIWESPET